MSNQASPFHAGELVVQERMGVREQIEPWARKVIRDFLPDEHRRFYAEQPFLVAAGRDASDRPWATLLADGPGFIRSPDAQTLEINAELAAGDALAEAFDAGADMGLLGIEFATRRRNRVNGRITQGRDGIRSLRVDQAFGNCPQYIHEREWERAPVGAEPSFETMEVLDAPAIGWIESADTFFIASGHRAEGEAAHYGMDASHRGGDPGFVRIEDERTLVFPDYAGNNHYNTIGNLAVDPRVGLLFVNFETGDMLQLTGRATIDWDSAALNAFPGAHRLVRIRIDALVRLENALPIRWKTTGGAVRSLRLAEKRTESNDVTSFMLVSRDGGALPDFEPGQHLPVEIPIPGHERRVGRTYSLSAWPETEQKTDLYRLTIKRESEGLVSRFLHDQLEVGDLISARSPAGDFILRQGTRPVVLISAGVGVTPMTSMLGRLSDPAEERPVWFIHGAKDGAHHPLAEEVGAQAASHARIRTHVAYSQPRPEDRQGHDFDSAGRISGDLIASLLPDLDADYYLCGPIGFMSSVYSDLEALGVPENQIHSETFGPAGAA